MTTDPKLAEFLDNNVPAGLHGLPWELATGKEDWADGQSLFVSTPWMTIVVHVHRDDTSFSIQTDCGDDPGFGIDDVDGFVRLDEQPDRVE